MANIGQELLNVPMDKMVNSMGLAISNAQYRLDKNSIVLAHMMSGVKEEDRVEFGGKKRSLLELGFTPTFYQFVDTIIEVKIAISMTTDSSATHTNSSTYKEEGDLDDEMSGFLPKGLTEDSEYSYCSTVNATYSSKYQYSVEGSSLLRTKLVPVPPPAILEERIRAMLEEQKASDAGSQEASGTGAASA